MNFVEKYQQEMAPEQMLAIAKAVGKSLTACILPAKYGTQ